MTERRPVVETTTDDSARGDPILSIIVCTYNRAQLLQMCLDSLVPQMARFAATTEVVVVDNNSGDGTPALLRAYAAAHPWLVAERESRQGLSHARNRGAQRARGAHLCFLDDDGKAGPAYLENLHRVIRDEHPDIFGGPVYPYYTSRKPAWFKDEFEIRKHAARSGYCNCAISGGNFVIRADLLRELGMFSPDLGMVGRRVRLGEERAVLERYRASRDPGSQRVYYCLDCFILHHVPPHKMTRWYMVKRGFQAGRANVVAKNERFHPQLVRKLTRTFIVDALGQALSRERETERFVLAMQRCALLAGKLEKHLELYLRRTFVRSAR